MNKAPVNNAEREQMISRVITALGRLKQPFQFGQVRVFGKDNTFLDKFCGTDNRDAKLRDEMVKAQSYCDSIGFRRIGVGSVSLAIIMLAENFSKSVF